MSGTNTTVPTPASGCGGTGKICHKHGSCEDISDCVCNAGYYGNGTYCTQNRCLHSDLIFCHPNADCIFSNSQSFCRCQSGYAGNGVTCTLIQSTTSSNSSFTLTTVGAAAGAVVASCLILTLIALLVKRFQHKRQKEKLLRRQNSRRASQKRVITPMASMTYNPAISQSNHLPGEFNQQRSSSFRNKPTNADDIITMFDNETAATQAARRVASVRYNRASDADEQRFARSRSFAAPRSRTNTHSPSANRRVRSTRSGARHTLSQQPSNNSLSNHPPDSQKAYRRSTWSSHAHSVSSVSPLYESFASARMVMNAEPTYVDKADIEEIVGGFGEDPGFEPPYATTDDILQQVNNVAERQFSKSDGRRIGSGSGEMLFMEPELFSPRHSNGRSLEGSISYNVDNGSHMVSFQPRRSSMFSSTTSIGSGLSKSMNSLNSPFDGYSHGSDTHSRTFSMMNHSTFVPRGSYTGSQDNLFRSQGVSGVHDPAYAVLEQQQGNSLDKPAEKRVASTGEQGGMKKDESPYVVMSPKGSTSSRLPGDDSSNSDGTTAANANYAVLEKNELSHLASSKSKATSLASLPDLTAGKQEEEDPVNGTYVKMSVKQGNSKLKPESVYAQVLKRSLDIHNSPGNMQESPQRPRSMSLRKPTRREQVTFSTFIADPALPGEVDVGPIAPNPSDYQFRRTQSAFHDRKNLKKPVKRESLDSMDWPLAPPPENL